MNKNHCDYSYFEINTKITSFKDNEFYKKIMLFLLHKIKKIRFSLDTLEVIHKLYMYCVIYIPLNDEIV